MEEKLKITDDGLDVKKYCDENGIPHNKISENDFLVVPSKYSDGEYYYSQEAIDFIKYCRQEKSKCKCDILSEGNIKVRSLHSFDIWMPVIWIASEIALPLVISILASFIYEKMKGREKEDVNVDLTITVNNGKKTKSLHYKGDAKTFKESFEKIDITKL